MSHRFGGKWTDEKLERVRKYLAAYTILMTRNVRAQNLRTIYVDAFAGTGYRAHAHKQTSDTPPLFEYEPDQNEFLKGSARIALEVEPPFNQYLFIEQNPERSRHL